MELHTATREKVPLVMALMNNQSYGNIYFRAAKMGPGREHLTDIPGIDRVAFAKWMGVWRAGGTSRRHRGGRHPRARCLGPVPPGSAY
jgi:hypothetical protein